MSYFVDCVNCTLNLYFSQAWLSNEKIGEGIGKSRREALHKAAEASIQNLAGKTS